MDINSIYIKLLIIMVRSFHERYMELIYEMYAAIK